MKHGVSHTFAAVAASAAACVTLCAGGAPAATAAEGPVDAGVMVEAIDGLSEDFIGGMDVSSMLSLEESGVTFKNADGQSEDLFELLASSGVNWVRLRVWNDPYTADGQGYGGGNVDAERALIMAERATAAGMRVLVDFHYSDFWADPSKQQAPKAWSDFAGDAERTAQAVYEYTVQTLTSFKEAGVDVGMVQIGNETTAKIAGVSGWDGMSEVFSAGSRAVREVLPEAKVAIHVTNPEKAGAYATYAKQLDEHDVDYDVFASSYYPFWHGSTDNLTSVLKQVASTYHKDVMVAETSWAYTLEDGDDDSNTVPSKVADSELTRYDISEQGQADEVRAVAAAVHAVGDNDGDGSNDGLGVFYWEPAWVPVGTGGKDNAELVDLWNRYGGGWATEAAGEYDAADAGKNWGGSGVDNQALFDFDGQALASLPIFSYLHTGAVTEHVFTSIDPVRIEATEDDAIAAIKALLPQEVTARYRDGVDEQERVTWQEDALDWIRGAGTYVIDGVTVAGHSTTATIIVAETPQTNLVGDGSFEDASADALWSISGTGAAITEADASDGTRALHFWDDGDFTFSVSRTIRGLEAGEYTLSAKVQGAHVGTSAANTLTLCASGAAMDGSACDDMQLDGWLQWDTASVPVSVGQDGAVTIVIDADLSAGDWGTIDEVSLVRSREQTVLPDTGDLQAAAAQAQAIDRTGWTSESLTALDRALAAADVLLAGSAYTEQDVADVTALIVAALDGLTARPFISISVTPHNDSYTVGDVIAPDDLSVVGNYEAGMGSVDLGPDEYTLDYDFSAPSASATVTVRLVADPSVSDAYTVTVSAPEGDGPSAGDGGDDGDDGADGDDGSVDGGGESGDADADADTGGDTGGDRESGVDVTGQGALGALAVSGAAVTTIIGVAVLALALAACAMLPGALFRRR